MSKRTRKNYEEVSQQEEKGRYNHITLEQRITLINMVTQDGFSVYRASKILTINNSTAKVIIRNYRKRGHIYRRKIQRSKRLQKVVLEIDVPHQLSNQIKEDQSHNENEVFQPQIHENLVIEPYANLYMCVCYPVCYLPPFYYAFGA